MSDSWRCGVHIADKLLGTGFAVDETARRLQPNSLLVDLMTKGLNAYPPVHVVSDTPAIRPERLNARSHAAGTYCDSGSTSVSIYTLLGEINSDVMLDRSDVACMSASLSVQDLLSVMGASGREGLQRTAPRRSKLERPRSAEDLVGFGVTGSMVRAGFVHGVESSWAAMMSSMLESPHGASEQYMWTTDGVRSQCLSNGLFVYCWYVLLTSGWMVKGWKSWTEIGSSMGRA